MSEFGRCFGLNLFEIFREKIRYFENFDQWLKYCRCRMGDHEVRVFAHHWALPPELGCTGYPGSLGQGNSWRLPQPQVSSQLTSFNFAKINSYEILNQKSSFKMILKHTLPCPSFSTFLFSGRLA